MKLLIVLMFFFGILLIIHGIYEEKFKKLKDNVKIQYRFVPRSYYDEQIFSNQFSSKFSNIFDEDQDEWSANQRTFEPKKGDPSEAVEATYNYYIQAARNLVPVETNIKGWEHLSPAAKKNVEKALAKEGFKTQEDVLEARVGDNNQIIGTANTLLGRGLVETVNGILPKPREPDSN